MRMIEDSDYGLNQYQYDAKKTANYPRQRIIDGILYCSLGLSGEVGEVLNQIKKIIRDDNGVLTKDRQDKILDELGDVLWYLSQLCAEMGFLLSTVATVNINKLQLRQRKGTIQADKRTECVPSVLSATPIEESQLSLKSEGERKEKPNYTKTSNPLPYSCLRDDCAFGNVSFATYSELKQHHDKVHSNTK